MRHKPTSSDYKSRIKTFVRGTLSFPGSVLTLSAEGQTAAAETFDREPLGTEFSSKSNIREGLRFGEQVHGDCGPGEISGVAGSTWCSRTPSSTRVLSHERAQPIRAPSAAWSLGTPQPRPGGQRRAEKPSPPRDEPSRPVPEEERAAAA